MGKRVMFSVRVDAATAARIAEAASFLGWSRSDTARYLLEQAHAPLVRHHVRSPISTQEGTK